MNPIVDWSDDDVWNFLRDRKIKVNPLYEQGFLRVGCVGCPMSGSKGMLREFGRYPKYKKLYINAFDRFLKRHDEDWKAGCKMDWNTGEDVFNWWCGINSSQITIDQWMQSREEQEDEY